MAYEESQYQIGGSVAPLTITGNSLLEDCDPAIFHMLGYFRFVLDYGFSTRWLSEAQAAGVNNISTTSCVGEYVSYDPTEYFQTTQYKFPLLAMYRAEENYTEVTRSYFAAQGTVKVLFALPPLEAAQYNKLNPILVRMARAILDRNEQGWDPNYLNGQLVYQTAGIMGSKVENCSLGKIKKMDNSNLYFPAFELTFTIDERRNEVAGAYSMLDGIDGYVNISDGNSELDFIEFSEDLT